MNKFFVSLLIFTHLSLLVIGQEVIQGIPEDLNQKTLVILFHSPIAVGSDSEDEASAEYILERQENHNRVLKEFNKELEVAVKKYPLNYRLAEKKELSSNQNSDEYILYSEVYDYKHLIGQPNEDELIVFNYYIKGEDDKIYKLFAIDEMKVYDAKLIIRKINRQLKKNYPELFNN